MTVVTCTYITNVMMSLFYKEEAEHISVIVHP